GQRLLEKARHVSLVVGPHGYRALPALVERAREGERAIATSFDLEEHYEDFQPKRFDRVKAWIPVQRGCDYRCTYCIVPYTRGAERSRRLADVVREVEQVVADGMTEVVLLGQTVNSYHDVAETLSAGRDARFADAFTFIFSFRDGTPATKLPPELTVPQDVAADRMARLIETVRGMSRARNLQLLGQRYEVLVEKGARRGD